MKSILFTLVTFLFLFSACSTARYGHLTTRSHSDYSKTERQVKVKKKVEDQVENVVLATKTDEILEELPIDQEVLPELQEEIAEVAPTVGKKELKEAATLAVELMKEKPLTQAAVKAKVQKFAKTKPAATNAEGGIVRLILIVLLILLVIELVAWLIPPIKWALHVLALIVLIWFLLKLLGYM